MRTLFFTVVILFWLCVPAFAACACKCKFVQEYVKQVSSSGDCGTRYILRDGKVYVCTCTKVQGIKRI